MSNSPEPVWLHPVTAQKNPWVYNSGKVCQGMGLSGFFGMISIVLSITGVEFSMASRSHAQEHPGCFMENKTGNLVFLNQVCTLPVMDAKTSISSPGRSGVYQAKILRRQQGIPVIQVLVNNRPFDMMVDTGASGVVITPTMAEALGVAVTGKAKANTPSQRDVEFDFGSVASIEVEGLVRNNLNVAIAPSLEIGLLGQDFFGDYDVTLKQDVIEFKARQ